MGSKAGVFREWAVGEGLAYSSSIEQIKGMRIGIDAEEYVHALISNPGNEPLLPALGGLPFTIHQRIDEDLQRFKDFDIEPFFVFNGLDLACRDRAGILQESRKATAILSDAWNTYDNAKGEEAVAIFGRACTYRSYHIVRSMQVYLHSQGAFTQTAPYSAASQLAYLVRKEFLDAVLGSASCLIFGAEKVITTFDWASSSFLWVEQKKCLTKLGLNQEQFASLCLLAGASLVPPMPEIDNDTSIPKMQAARSLMSRAGNNIDIIVHEMKDDNYREAFHRARYAVKFPIIMSLEGEVEAENSKERPQDVHEFIGRRLPEEIYFYLSRGVVGPRVLNWRTRMLVLETPPLDGGNSQVYKDLVENKLLPLRAQALALMTQSLNRYYQKQDVDLVCWWDERASKTLDIPDRAGSTKSIENWHVTSEKFSSLADQRDPGASLWYAISSLSKESDAKSTVTPRESSSSGQLVKVQDVRANAVWRFLADRGYINSDHTLSAWGKALKTAFDRAADDKLEKLAPSWSEVEEAIFIAFELLRLDLLGTENMFQTPPYSGAPMKGTDTDKAFALLISRIACLATFQHAKIGYTGPLSRHLLAYHQCAASVRDALRDLLEMHACSMLLSGAVNREWETTDYSDVGDSLPFMNEPDLGLGLMVKCYLDEQSSELNRRQDIGKWLPHATDIQGDLNKAWKIWAAINAGVQTAETGTFTADTRTTFKKADEWLAQKLREANAPNGTA